MLFEHPGNAGPIHFDITRLERSFSGKGNEFILAVLQRMIQFRVALIMPNFVILQDFGRARHPLAMRDGSREGGDIRIHPGGSVGRLAISVLVPSANPSFGHHTAHLHVHFVVDAIGARILVVNGVTTVRRFTRLEKNKGGILIGKLSEIVIFLLHQREPGKPRHFFLAFFLHSLLHTFMPAANRFSCNI